LNNHSQDELPPHVLRATIRIPALDRLRTDGCGRAWGPKRSHGTRVGQTTFAFIPREAGPGSRWALRSTYTAAELKDTLRGFSAERPDSGYWRRKGQEYSVDEDSRPLTLGRLFSPTESVYVSRCPICRPRVSWKPFHWLNNPGDSRSEVLMLRQSGREFE
jgi:hypothetical protein